MMSSPLFSISMVHLLTRRGTRKPLFSCSTTVSRLTPNSWPGWAVLVDLLYASSRDVNLTVR